MKVTSECFEALAMSGVIDDLQVSDLQEYTKENKENIKEIMVEMESIEYSGAAKLPQMMMSALIVSMPNNVLGLIIQYDLSDLQHYKPVLLGPLTC